MNKLLIAVLLTLGLGVMFSSCGKNAIEGYEWLEGEWEGYSDYDEWGKIIITSNSYKFVCSNTKESIEDISKAEKLPISIGIEDNYILGEDVLALDKNNPLIVIDDSNQQLYILTGEFSRIILNKKPVYDNITITYTTYDNKKINPYKESKFKKSIKSHTYENGEGIIVLKSGISTINNESFKDCKNLVDITIPMGLTSIGDGAFERCSALENISISSSVTSIGKGAFYKCFALKNIAIPEGVTSIGGSAFQSCGIKEIIIGKNVTQIGGWIFSECYNLEKIICQSSNPPICTENTFDKLTRIPHIYVPREGVSAYRRADGWKEYANYIRGF